MKNDRVEYKLDVKRGVIPSDESKVHIEVLSVLWGNRLPISDDSFPLSRLVPSCFVTYDLELLSLPFDFVDSKNLLDRVSSSKRRVFFTRVLDFAMLLVSLTGKFQAVNTNLASHLPQCCLMMTLEGFPFVIVNTKEYHSECSGRITRIMRRTLVNSL
ncbi:hypothetical protein Tco_1419988 [Tanacetum coccineum]